MRGSWLFVREIETIWIRRPESAEFDLIMRGPRLRRRHYAFADELELQEFLSNIEELFVATGWSLVRFQPGRDRRSGGDRREVPRGADRREL